MFFDKRISQLRKDKNFGYTWMIASAGVYLNGDFKIRWSLPQTEIKGVYKDYVIGMDKDYTRYFIINKNLVK